MKRAVIIVVIVALSSVSCDAKSLTPATSSSNGKSDGLHHVVVDTDLAFDDIMALLYLLQRDNVSVDAVTVTGTGEVHCDPGVRNAQALLALGGSPETPVACGRETPLGGQNAFPDEWRAAVDDLSMLDLPNVSGEADPRGAVGLLLDVLDDHTTLITLGPLTNVAEALRVEPALADRVSTFVAMAGAIDVPGNAPRGIAEYNVWADPLAAKEVIQGMNVTLVPLDATNDVPFTQYFADVLERNLRTSEAEAAFALISTNKDLFLSDGYSFWDTLATALVFQPDLATWDKTPVSVTASTGAVGWTARDDRTSPVLFANGVPDPLAFEREYLTTLTGGPIGSLRPEPTVTVVFDGRRCTVSPTSLSAGTHDVAFVGDVGADAIAILVRLPEGRSYREMRKALAPPGSELHEQDPAIRKVDPFGWIDALAPIAILPGKFAAICLSGDASSDALPRAWLSARINVV